MDRSTSLQSHLAGWCLFVCNADRYTTWCDTHANIECTSNMTGLWTPRSGHWQLLILVPNIFHFSSDETVWSLTSNCAICKNAQRLMNSLFLLYILLIASCWYIWKMHKTSPSVKFEMRSWAGNLSFHAPTCYWRAVSEFVREHKAKL